jgi:GWxTD domain-containing protein
MSSHLCAFLSVLGVSFGVVIAPAAAQDIDISDIFSNQRFYDEHELLQATGDVRFIADVWYLPGSADSTRALIGISLSNSALQFVRSDDGRWQAEYGVTASLEPEGTSGGSVEKTWQQSVSVGTFDETLLTGETIVFQTDLALAPGEYELALTVRDRNADHGSRVTGSLEVPSLPRARLALSEPVLLRLYRQEGQDTEFVVHPSHYYPSSPDRIDFLAKASGASPQDAPYSLRVRLLQAGEDKEPVGPAWTDDLSPDSSGTLEAFGSLENPGAQFGEFDLTLELRDVAGNVLASESTPIMIAGSSAWIAANWEDALRLIRYEATENEVDILEEIEDPNQRLEAWNCFWKIRDPVPATATNEALVDYFERIETANRTWKSALRPGYQSDRGRVYITLGPPDEIIERAMPAGPVPYEIWRYYDYSVEIRFIDRIGFNNYELDNIGEYQSELSRLQRRKLRFLHDRANECPLLAPAFE